MRGDRPTVPEHLVQFSEVEWTEPYQVPPGATQEEAENIWVRHAVNGYRRWQAARTEWAEAHGLTQGEFRSLSREQRE